MIRGGSAPFINRKAELSFLRRTASVARGRVTQVVLVTGESGQGKTRLCREVIHENQREGALTLEGGAIRGEGGFLAPVVASLRGARRQHDNLWQALRSRAGWLYTLLPELRSQVREEAHQPDRLLIFESVLDALVDAAGESVAVWLLDDMHWADNAAWAFVRHVCRLRSSPLVLLVALRHYEADRTAPVREHLADLEHQADVAHIRLQPLTPDHTMALVRASAEADLPDSNVMRIVEWSGGNPAIAEEMAAAGLRENVAVPESVRLRLQQRTSELDVEARRLLEVAAVVGSGTSPDLVLSLAGGTDERHLEQLLDGGLLSLEHGSDIDSLRFAHPVFRQAAYELMPWSRRRALHLDVARQLGSTQQPELLQQVAHHLEMGGNLEAAVQKLLGAAELAREQGQAESALELDLAALGLTGRRAELAGQRQDVLAEIVKKLASAGKWSILLPLAREAWHGRDQLDPACAAEVTAILGMALLVTGQPAKVRSVLDPEIAGLSAARLEKDPPRLLLTAAFAAAVEGRLQTLVHHLQAAARSRAPAAAEWTRCLSLALDFTFPVERQSLAAEFERLADSVEAEEPTLRAFALWNRARMTIQLRDAVEAENLADLTDCWVRILARLVLATLHLLEGRAQAATEALAQARAETDSSMRLVSWLLNALEIQLQLHLGHVAEAGALLNALEPNALLPNDWSRGLAAGVTGWLAWEEGDLENAAAKLGMAYRLSSRTGYGLFQLGPILLPLQVDALLNLGREKEAGRAVESATADFGYPDRFLRAALAAGRFRLQPNHETARRAEDEAGQAQWPWLHALVLCWQAERFNSEDIARTAMDRFTSIGARAGVARAETVVRKLASQRPRVDSRRSAAQLSRRELTIAAMVAQGLTNPQIAARLFLSSATVSTHVKHIFSKLGFASRAQIAGWLTSSPGQAALAREPGLVLEADAAGNANDKRTAAG